MKAPGLQQKFTLTLIGGGLILLLVLGGLWYSSSGSHLELIENTSTIMREQAWEDLERRGEVTVRFLADTLPNLMYYYDLQGLRDTAISALDQEDILYVLIYDIEGRILHDGTRTLDRFGEVMDDELAAAAIQADDLLTQWHSEALDISMPVRLGRDRIGGVRIGLSRSGVDEAIGREQAAMTERLQAIFSDQMRMLLLAFLLLLAVAGVLGWQIGRGLVRPIRELAGAVRSLESGKFDEISLSSRSGDELGVLIRSFTHMAATMRKHDHDIRRLAYQDNLTSLPNRLMFRELLDDAIAEYPTNGGSLGLMFIDLDNFKRINDTLGHDAGDEVLIEFAARLRQCTGQVPAGTATGRIVIARLGGDEFVALLSGENVKERCRTLARNILDLVQEPFQAANRSVYLSASIGITRFPEDAHNSKLLLKCGDLAMYQAKLQGKNCYAFFSDELTALADQQLLLEQHLREALAAGQVTLAYQPIMAVDSGRLVAAEALLRWTHPELGEVPPERFVAAAEASTLIDELGARTLKQACQDAADWQARLPGIGVGVNVSGRQLLKRGLDEIVIDALTQSGLEPGLLSLELTESSLLHDHVLASSTLSDLRQRGIRIWLDDFGTGFSGLSHLRQVQVDGVKIDRSFIADVLTDADDLALTSAIIAMAHSIGMPVIGEGVENEEQLAVLKNRGCDYVQGYLLGRAMPVEAFLERFGPDHASD